MARRTWSNPRCLHTRPNSHRLCQIRQFVAATEWDSGEDSEFEALSTPPAPQSQAPPQSLAVPRFGNIDLLLDSWPYLLFSLYLPCLAPSPAHRAHLRRTPQSIVVVNPGHCRFAARSTASWWRSLTESADSPINSHFIATVPVCSSLVHHAGKISWLAMGGHSPMTVTKCIVGAAFGEVSSGSTWTIFSGPGGSTLVPN